MKNRREFLRTSLGIASMGIAGHAVPAAALPPALGRGQIKIRDVETVLLRFPPGRPTADAIHTFGPERGGLVVKIHTDAGITGWGYSSFGMIRGGPSVVGTIVKEELRPA